jgi:sterol desaturase/sphingolipid hydroxylase (fatty acid hydroxylase superfamily)
MHLGKTAYYADFVIFPILVVACAATMVLPGPNQARLWWPLAALFGLVLWTLLEYLTHRFLLHRVPGFEEAHDAHHRAPTALIGTPSWGTIAIALFVIFLPSVGLLGLVLGSGVTAGVLTGYIWYSCVHHAVHQWKLKPGSYLYRAKLRHARHHHVHAACNYGVTMGWWDVVFRTTAAGGRQRVPQFH